MPSDFSEQLCAKMSEFVRSFTGLDFPRDRWQDLLRGIHDASSELCFKNPEILIKRFLSSSYTKKEFDTLIDHLTVGETFFFRDKNLFQVLKDHIIPQLLNTKNKKSTHMSFWSAGCASGEEPYSIAMLIDQMLPSHNGWEITIKGSDINKYSLQKAHKGIYTRWSFRETPDSIIHKYFTHCKKNSFAICEHIKNMVNFSQLNLAEGGYPSPINATQELDVIFCRNVLIYLTPPVRDQVIKRLTYSLSEGGWLILSPNETAFVQEPELIRVRFPGAFVYRKESFGENEIIHGNELLHDTEIIQGESRKDRYGYNEALDYYNNGCYKESMERLCEFLSSPAPDHDSFLLIPESMALLAKSLANLGRLDEAREWGQKAIDAEKLNPDNYYLLATIYQEQGHLNESVKSLRHALYLDPEFILAHFALGNISQQQGNYKESRRHIQNAYSLLLSMDPDEILPCSEGMTASGFVKVVESMINKGRRV